MELMVDGVPFLEPTGQTLMPLQISPLSQGVHCLHSWWQDWGPNQQRLAVHNYKHMEALHKNRSELYRMPPPPTLYSRAWAQKRLEDALTKIGQGLVIAAFPSFVPYNKYAALLLENGFSLLDGRCYPNANYSFSGYSTGIKGGIYSPDAYPHWIHLWLKDLKGLENCGELTFGLPATPNGPVTVPVPNPVPRPQVVGFPNCCGLRLRWTPGEIKSDPYGSGNSNRHLAICQIPADQKFPSKTGWKRFALYKDFKWGVNFDSPTVKGVQKCTHVFDLAKIEAWELAQPLPTLAWQ